MVNRFLLIITLLFTLLCHVSAQSDLTEDQVKEFTSLGAELEGTFQIQMIDDRSLPIFDLNLYEIINNKRKQDVDVYHYVSAHMRILILSNNRIESVGFDGIDRVKYISSVN